MGSFVEGREARINGQTRDSNPFPSGPMHDLWDEGWMTSDTIMRALVQ